MILAVTGHRPPKVGGYGETNPVFLAITEAIDRELLRLQPEVVVTGMALGVDQWAAQLCVYNDIPFIAAVPFDGFDSMWPQQSQERYRSLLACARDIHVVSPNQPYSPVLLQRRNEWMVWQADALLAVCSPITGGRSGTRQTMSAARRLGKEVIEVPVSQLIWQQAAEIERELAARKEARRTAMLTGVVLPSPQADMFVPPPNDPRPRPHPRRRRQTEGERRARVEAQRASEEEDRSEARRILEAQYESRFRQTKQEVAEEPEATERLKPRRKIEIGDD